MKTNTLIQCVMYYRSRLTGETLDSIPDNLQEKFQHSFAIAGYEPDSSHEKLCSVFSGFFRDKPLEVAVWASDTNHLDVLDAFMDDIKSLDVEPKLFDERTIGIAQHHFSALKAPVRDNADVSLFSFLKMAAAFSERETHTEALTLIGGDLSGLQSFLYDIVSKYAAKNLKGRSFYLQLLIEDVLLEICDTLKFKPWQVLYSSGGGFYILANHIDGLESALTKIRTDRNLSLFRAHGSALYLALDAIQIDQLKADGTQIGDEWKLLSEKLSAAKAARYGELMETHFDLFFGISQRADIKVDHITGRDIRDKIVIKKLKTGDDTETREISAITDLQIDLGKKLKSSDYWLVTSKESGTKGDNPFDFSTCKYAHHFLSGTEMESFGNAENVLSLKRFDTDTYLEAIPYGYGGNRYPKLETGTGSDLNATYEDFARAKDGEIERLGVLRMDIDNLGTAFIKGFRKRQHVFALYSELSMRLNDFFTHRINKMIAENEEFSRRVFVIYSGGDDLFAVGNWNVLIKFSEQVKTEFEVYMSGKYLTLSGGLSFVTSKYPILKAGELAGDAEERAKSFVRNTTSGTVVKDAIDLFGIPIGWEEYGAVEEWRDQWLEWFNTNQDGLNRSLLHKLFDYREIKNRNTGNLRWQWHAAYNISRRSKSSNKEEIDKIKALLYKGENKYRRLDLCCVGGRWADYLTRNQNN